MKFSVFCEQTRKLFDTFLHPDEDEDETRRRPSPPVPHTKTKTSYPYSYTAPSRMSRSSGNGRDIRVFSTDSKRRRRAAALLYKSSVMRRSWQALNQSHMNKNQTTTYIRSASMSGAGPYGPYSSMTEEVVRKTERHSPTPHLQSPPPVSAAAVTSGAASLTAAAAREVNPGMTSRDSFKQMQEPTPSRRDSVRRAVTTTTSTATAASTTDGKRLEPSQVLQSNASSVTYSCISSASSPSSQAAASSLLQPPSPTKSFESQGNQVHSDTSFIAGSESSKTRLNNHAADDEAIKKKEMVTTARISEAVVASEMRSATQAQEDDGSSTGSSSSAFSSALLAGSAGLSPTASPSPQDVNYNHRDDKNSDDLMMRNGNKCHINNNNNKNHDNGSGVQALLVRKTRRPGFSSRIIRKHSLSRDRHSHQPRDHVTIDIREKFTPENGSVIKITVTEKLPQTALIMTDRSCPQLQFNSQQEPDVVDQLSVLTVDCKHDVQGDELEGKDDQERGSPSSYSSSTSAYFSSTSSPPSSITSAAAQYKSGILKDRSNYTGKGSITLPSGRVVNGFPKKVHFAESSINFYCSNDRQQISESKTADPRNSDRESQVIDNCSNQRMGDPAAASQPAPISSNRKTGADVLLTASSPNRSVKAMISHFNSKGLDPGASFNKGSAEQQNPQHPSSRPTCNSQSPPTPSSTNTRPVLFGTQDNHHEQKQQQQHPNEKIELAAIASNGTRSSARKDESQTQAVRKAVQPPDDRRQLFTSSSSIYLEDARSLTTPSATRSASLLSDLKEADQRLQQSSPHSEQRVTQHFRSIHSSVSSHSQSLEKKISTIRKNYPPASSSSSSTTTTASFSPPASPASSCQNSHPNRSEDRANCVIHTAV